MSLELRELGDILIVDLTGRISLGEESGGLRECLRRYLHEHRPKIVLNFRSVVYMDSTSIGVLAESKALALDMGSKIRLAELPPFVEKLLRNVGLHQFLEIYTTEAEALADWVKT